MTDLSLGAPGDAAAFRIGDVFGQSLQLFKRRFAPLVAVTALVYAPLFLPPLLIGEMDVGAGAAAIAAAIAANLVLPQLASNAVCLAVVGDLRGEGFAAPQALGAALRRLAPVLAVNGLLLLVAAAAGLLLVAPGVMVLCAYMLAGPACLLEGRGVLDSFKRSAALTRGRRWLVFGVLLLSLLPGLALPLGLGAVLEALNFGAAAQTVASDIWSVLFGAFWAVLFTVLYLRLRAAREGAADITRVFD